MTAEATGESVAGVDLLHAVAAMLRARGWCTHSFCSDDGRIDVGYALVLAGDGRPAKERKAARDLLEAEVRLVLPPRKNPMKPDRSELVAWNDTLCRGLEDALAMIERATHLYGG